MAPISRRTALTAGAGTLAGLSLPLPRTAPDLKALLTGDSTGAATSANPVNPRVVTHVTSMQAGHGWAVGLLGYSWWHLAQGVSSAVGGLIAVWCFWWIGRTRSLRHWHGPPPPVAVRPWAFWGAAAVVLALCLAWLPFLPYRLSAHVTGVRLMWSVGLSLLAGAAVVHQVSTRRAPESHAR